MKFFNTSSVCTSCDNNHPQGFTLVLFSIFLILRVTVMYLCQGDQSDHEYDSPYIAIWKPIHAERLIIRKQTVLLEKSCKSKTLPRYICNKSCGRFLLVNFWKIRERFLGNCQKKLKLVGELWKTYFSDKFKKNHSR